MIYKKNKFIVFYSLPNDPRILRLQEESNKKGLYFQCFNLNKDILMNQDKIVDIKTGSSIDIENAVCWMLSNSQMCHYFENIYAKEVIFIWPNIEVINFSDKFLTGNFLCSIGVKTPETFLITHDNQVLRRGIDFVGGFPCVIKKTFGSGGYSVAIVDSIDRIKEIIKNIYSNKSSKEISPFFRASFILQKYIKDSKGEDFRVLCLDGEILGGIKRSSQNGDFRANIALGGRAEIFQVSEKLSSICKKILKKGNIFYAGIDFIKSGDEWIAIEINTSAQFQGFEEATGINVAEKIVTLLYEKYYLQ